VSPPAKTFEPQAATDKTTSEPGTPAPEGTTEGERSILDVLGGAGNRAVASLLSPTRAGVQRAPDDDDPRRVSGMAHAPTVDPRAQPAPNVHSATTEAPTQPQAPPTNLKATLTASTGASSIPPPVVHPKEDPTGDLQATMSASTGATSVAPPVIHPKEGAAGPAVGPAPGAGPAPGPGPAPAPGAGPAKPKDFQIAPGAKPYPGGGDPRFDVGGEFGPKAVGPGQAGGVGQKVWADLKPAKVYSDQQVEEAYKADPGKVIRSLDFGFHRSAWKFQGGFEKYGEKEPPKVWRAGNYYYVAPDWDGPATPLPNYRGSDVGLGKPAPTPPTPSDPKVLDQYGPKTPTSMRWAVSPETPAGKRGTQVAEKASYQDVAAAFAKNPASVVRSPNVDWHRQGFGLDGGEGPAPGAYRVGNLYIIEPDHRLKGVPKLGEQIASAHPDPRSLPQAAQLVSLPGTQYDESTRGRTYSSSMAKVGDRTEIRDRRTEVTPVHAQVIEGEESEEGGIKRRKERRIGGGFGAGGNLLGLAGGSTDTTDAGDDLKTTKTSKTALGATKDEKIALTHKRAKEFVYGKKPNGDPLKKGSGTDAALTVDTKTGAVGANVAQNFTGPGGGKTTVNFGASGDRQGNFAMNAGGGFESKGGTQVTTSLNASTKVVADEPVEQEDGSFLVSYRLESTGGGTFGLGKGKVAGHIGRSSTQLDGGTKAFPTLKEAEAWRKDAGAKMRAEQAVSQYIPITSMAGAMLIPVGSTRISGEGDTTSAGASASAGGNTLGFDYSSSEMRSLEIKHVSQDMFEVTGSVVGTKTGDWTLSNPVLSNSSGSTKTKSFAVTWAFDFSKGDGGQAFERYCRTGIPIPGGILRWIDTGSSDEDHDNYKIPYVGTASWSGTTWETSREDAAGHFQKAFGGKQSHKIETGLLGGLTGDKDRSSNAQIVRTSEDGDEKTARAELRIAGKSGSFNREEFGKIFMDKKGGAAAGEPSGEWTLSAEVPIERIRDLERANPDLRNAWNLDEKMRVYSRLVKDNGAQMLGGQVGMLSKSWDLELKGDANFPGGRERMRLNHIKDSLKAQLKQKPGDAYRIAREAKETLEKLEERLTQVSREDKYTDLPDGLRRQQIELVKAHIQDFTQVRQNALAAGISGSGTESYDQVQKRVASKVGYEGKPAEVEFKKVQDSLFLRDKQVSAIYGQIRAESKALGDVVKKNGDIAARNLTTDDDRTGFHAAQPGTMLRVKNAYALAAQDEATRKEIEKLRLEMDTHTDPAERLPFLKAIDTKTLERLKILKQMLDEIELGGVLIAPYATKNAMEDSKAFWRSVGGNPD
jgi:hypothetical protein